MVVPDRRTVIVLATLIGAMTLASGVLLVLEPKPGGATGPRSPIVLSSLNSMTEPEKALFETVAAPDRNAWLTIVIQQSGASEGSTDALGKLHERLGLGGLGYHFVIGNGKGMP